MNKGGREYGSVNGSGPGHEGKLARYQAWVFFVTFVAYANSHFSRKSYTQVKTQLESDAGMTPAFLGGLDTMFMFSYALGSFLMGNLGDRLRPAAVVGAGLWGAGVCVLLFAQGAITDVVPSYPVLSLIGYQALWLVHGVFQSTGGPVNTAIMGSWFPAKNRGLIFGLWTCHQYLGNIVSAFVAAAVLSSPIDYWWNMIIAAVCSLVWGCLLYFCTPSRPEEVGLSLDGDAPPPVQEEGEDLPPPITFGEALKIPGVSTYAMAFGFFKLVNYVIFFWLPFFLAKTFTPEMGNMISSLYDVGMMPGGIIVGAVSDAFGGRRATVCSLCFILLCPLLYVFSNYSDTVPMWGLLVMLLLMGTFVGGPNNIITSAVAADLATDPTIQGNNRALGTVTGIINGSGSIIAALGLLCIAPLQAAFGWASVWTMLIVSVLLGCGLLGGKIWSELTQPTDYESVHANKPKKIHSVDSFEAFKVISEKK
mmetsp:Transcript_6244/g.8273  ORF Transcript_6244/g.8273 Transcript_6244/m.8273 type:complete len:479 (-) Transcript_6244:511-1947(-)